jgi:hypothetical protein
MKTLEACWLEPVKKRNFVVGAEAALKKFLQQACSYCSAVEGWSKLLRLINFEKNGELHKKEGLLTHLKAFILTSNI